MPSDQILARDATERQYHALGIPRLYWTADLKGLRFCATPLRDQSVSAAGQRQVLKAVVKEPRRQLVVVSSTPTDGAALQVAFAMTRGLLLRKRRVAIIDLQHEWPEQLESPQILIVHNVLDRCTDDRAQHCRDVLVRNAGLVRIVATNTQDPYGWACSRLGLRPTAVAAILE